MVMAASLTLPMALKDVGEVLRTTQQKDEEGKRLIKLFSAPCKPTKSNGGRTRNLPHHLPEDWAKFKYYCIQDVNTEVDIYKRLKRFPMPAREWHHYRVNERINDRGVRIDTELVQQAITCDLLLSDAMTTKAYELTGLENPNSVSQLKTWLDERGISMDTLGKKNVTEMIGELDKNGVDAEAMEKFNAQSGGPSEEIARLAGSRFVNISEPEKKITLDAALTKRLTGNDTITARYLHENSFEFRPNFKIFINTNHRPNITDLTLFESGRIKIIPFDRHFDEKEQDKGLKGFFAEPENMSGILNWMLEGYKMFRSQGLEMPDSVVQATMDYQMFSDKMGQFFSECLQPKADSELRRAAVYTRYKEWCAENGYRADSAKVLNAEIDKRYTVQKKRPADGVGSTTQIVLGVEFCLSETTKGDFNVVPE